MQLTHVPQRGELSRHQQLLAEIRDKLCDGNAAELARQIGKDATYVNRLFYPGGKPGRKGIGLEIMAACNRAFHLPVGFWDQQPPALTEAVVKRIQEFTQILSKPGVSLGAESEDGRVVASFLDERKAELLARGAQLDVAASSVAEPRAAYGMTPILAWEHPDDLPDGEFVMVPRLDVHLSAGNGHDQVQIELTKDNPQAFRTEWVRLMRLKPNKLAAMRASGDSMEPTIHDGDSLLVDTSQTDVVDGKVYALWYEGGERVKRLHLLPGGGLRIESDNPRFKGLDLTGPETEHVRIIGRVVHRSGIGGL
jgi:phage repressor protein C with HTH and peptisase S24 domain